MPRFVAKGNPIGYNNLLAHGALVGILVLITFGT